MNKNAYEIRLEVLQLAHKIVTEGFMAKRDDLTFKQGNGLATEETLHELFPKTEEILNKAAELYKFVESK